MFVKLSRKIIYTLLAAASICTLLIGGASYYFANHIIRSEYESLAVGNFRSSSDTLANYLTYMAEKLKIIASHPTIRRAVQTNRHMTEVTDILDQMMLSLNMNVHRLVVYDWYGHIYSQSSYSNPPSLSALRENSQINELLASKVQNSIWIPRFDNVGMPNINHANPRNRVLSYIMNIPDDSGNPLALVVMDLQMEQISRFFQTDNALFKRAQSYLFHNDSQFSSLIGTSDPLSVDSTELAVLQSKESGSLSSADGKSILIFGSINQSSEKIVLVVPMSVTSDAMKSVRWFIVALTAFNFILAVLLIRKLKSSIVRPLTMLLNKMREFISTGRAL